SQVPDPQELSTFEQSRLDWSELGRTEHAEMLQWYQALIALRRSHPALRSGRLDEIEVTYDEAARWLVVLRKDLAIAVNLGPERQRVPLPSAPSHVLLEQGSARLTSSAVALDADGVAIISFVG